MRDLPSTSRKSQIFRIMFAAGLAYSAVVMPMASLGMHVSRDWGMSNFLAGLVAGASFYTTLMGRKPAGEIADHRGGRFSFIHGCLFHAAGGAVCLAATLDILPVSVRFAILLAGRLLVGIGESKTNIGATYWLVGIVDPNRIGRTLATLGMCIYGSVAIGGWTGFYLFESVGFSGVMAVCILMPLLGLALVFRYGDASLGHCRTVTPLGKVLRSVWPMGLPASCVAVGFPIVGTFLAKTFLDRGWEFAGWGFTLCGVGFVVMRVLFGHLPDQIGGQRVAIFSAALEVIGLLVLWRAAGPVSALIGAFLTGAGLSLIFPCLAMQVAKTAPLKMRGVSISCFNIFIDVAYGFAAPVAGILNDRFGDSVAYLFAAIAAGIGLVMIARRHQAWHTVRPPQ